jgi:hypothetical protein
MPDVAENALQRSFCTVDSHRKSRSKLQEGVDAGTRQLLLRIDKRLVEREFRVFTGSDEAGSIEFDMPPVDDMVKVGTFARYLRMLCDYLRSEVSDLSHPLVADRWSASSWFLM